MSTDKRTLGELWQQINSANEELARRIGALQGDLDAERKRREACEKKPEVERRLAVAEQTIYDLKEHITDLKSRLTRALDGEQNASIAAAAAKGKLSKLEAKLKAGDLSVLEGASLAPAPGITGGAAAAIGGGAPLGVEVKA
jgi:chromosome segregation ATPase